MSRVAVELSHEELERLREAGFEATAISASNLDGQLVETVMISLTSAASLKVLATLFVDFVKARRSSAIKVNGVEIQNVSEATVLKVLEKSAAGDG